MATARGNAAKKQVDNTDGPWLSWTETDRAERAIRFIETYCVLPKGYRARKHIILREDQKEWIREILADGIRTGVKSCPRGQGKSTEFAALALWATFDESDSGEPQVPIVATTVGQAIRSVYGVALKMLEKEPELFNRCTTYSATNNMRIEVAATGGTCFPIANDVDGLQGLDPSLAIVDEIGFQPYETWTSVKLAAGKRPHSLVAGFGTPGFDKTKALWQIRQKWLEAGKKVPGQVFYEIAAPEGCDHRDEKFWYMANPALRAGTLGLDSLQQDIVDMHEAEFRIFRLGQWAEGVNSWLGEDGRGIWNALQSPYEFDPEEPMWVAVDVGLKRDSTALIMIQRRTDTGKLHAKAKIWMPQKDEAVDISAIMEEIRLVCGKYPIREIAYDPRLFEYPAQMLYLEGFPMVEFPQSIERMSPAYGLLLQAIKRGDLTHDGDTAFTTQVLNGIPRFNERGFMLDKAKSRGKIDATTALAMAFDRATSLEPPEGPLVFSWLGAED